MSKLIKLVAAIGLCAPFIAAQAEVPKDLLDKLSPAQRAQAEALLAERAGAAGLSGRQTEKPVETVSTVRQRVVQTTDEPAKQDGELPLYGYDLFAGQPVSFESATDIPIPADYVVGPGDLVKIYLYGATNGEYDLAVSRRGTLNLPELGPLNVAGMQFSTMQNTIVNMVKEKMIGTQASVSLGELRSLRVFVLGEAYRPGSYTVSSLSNITNALVVSGGIRKTGSLRQVQLKRNGAVVSTLDLYDFLMRGDTTQDMRLLPNDVLFVPPRGKTVGISGAVQRPARYELLSERTVAETIELAGGLLPQASRRDVSIRRITPVGVKYLTINVGSYSGQNIIVKAGDEIIVNGIAGRERAVTVKGHVWKPGQKEWYAGMTLADLFSNLDSELKPRVDLEYVVIRRHERPGQPVSVITTSFSRAGAIALRSSDEVHVFSLDDDRSIAVRGIVDELRVQPGLGATPQVASVLGGVRFPGVYPLGKGDTLRAHVVAAGGFVPNVDMNYAVVVREKAGSTDVEVIDVNLARVMAGRAAIRLKPNDKVIIFTKTAERSAILEPLREQLSNQASLDDPLRIVSVSGSVRDPNKYPLSQGMRVSDLIRAASGLSESAYTVAAELTRYDVVAGQRMKMKHMPIDVVGALRGDSAKDITLQSRDVLHIKRLPEWVKQMRVEIAGEVRFPGTYSIVRGETLSQLLQRAGGLTEYAFPEGTRFTRQQLVEKERKQLQLMARQLEADLAAVSLEALQSDPEKAAAYTQAKGMLTRLQTTEPVGRLVIDLPGLMAQQTVNKDVVLQEGDVITIPQKPQEVTVVGEVQFGTSHLWDPTWTRTDYLKSSGGLTERADDERIYVIRASGRVIAADDSRWFRADDGGIRPGDTIVVPLDADRIRPITLWANVTQIIYQLGLAAASFKTVGVF